LVRRQAAGPFADRVPLPDWKRDASQKAGLRGFSVRACLSQAVGKTQVKVWNREQSCFLARLRCSKSALCTSHTGGRDDVLLPWGGTGSGCTGTNPRLPETAATPRHRLCGLTVVRTGCFVGDQVSELATMVRFPLTAR